MPEFLLHHRHAPDECRAAWEAWKGFASPLRQRVAVSTCLHDGHAVWWTASADGPDAALALLPRFVAERTEPIEVREVLTP